MFVSPKLEVICRRWQKMNFIKSSLPQLPEAKFSLELLFIYLWLHVHIFFCFFLSLTLSMGCMFIHFVRSSLTSERATAVCFLFSFFFSCVSEYRFEIWVFFFIFEHFIFFSFGTFGMYMEPFMYGWIQYTQRAEHTHWMSLFSEWVCAHEEKVDHSAFWLWCMLVKKCVVWLPLPLFHCLVCFSFYFFSYITLLVLNFCVFTWYGCCCCRCGQAATNTFFILSYEEKNRYCYSWILLQCAMCDVVCCF